MALRQLADSTVIVTGAAGGIGSEIARAVASAGARVMLADQNADGLERLRTALVERGHTVAASQVDIADPRSARGLAEATLDEFGGIDALVNNAGIDAPRGSALDLAESEWRRVVEVNLSGTWWCTSAVLDHMAAARGGRVVNISSIAARLGAHGYSPAYAAAKAGVVGLTVGLAVELEEYGIRVNAITPGATGNTGTPLLPDERQSLLSAFPLGLGGPQPIAAAVCFLLDTTGDWISGAVLNISGGQLRGL
jgi:3-oxoacyl-[acyl-carrier protein] reductase